MRTSLAFATLLMLIVGTAIATPIMVWSGKLTPITPRLPPPPMPVPYPPLPPAPVNEDPEPINSLLYRRTTIKYGFRIKPLKTYGSTYEIPDDSYGKGVLFGYD